MGNAGSSGRERHKSAETSTILNLPTPTTEKKPFKNDPSDYQSLNDEEGPCYTKNMLTSTIKGRKGSSHRQRANTVSEGAQMTEKLYPTVFKWNGGGQDVLIGGSFSDWKTIPMVKSHQDFVTIVDLPEGEHHFKFYVDGEWKHDPSRRIVENDLGAKNNMIDVKNSDFEVFQALAMDSKSVNKSRDRGGKRDYGQEIPSIKPWDKPAGPPILPPHLLQVILNRDVPISREPTILPEPNHVMLNHLYALTIKDGVLVLSATHRFRKKCVTTLLYKPI